MLKCCEAEIDFRIDIATAATAVRNLNGYDIGTRQLRVDFSEKEMSSRGPGQTEVPSFSKTFLLSSRDKQIYYQHYRKENNLQQESPFQTQYLKLYKHTLHSN